MQIHTKSDTKYDIPNRYKYSTNIKQCIDPLVFSIEYNDYLGQFFIMASFTFEGKI
jgi:hypothetical protein